MIITILSIALFIIFAVLGGFHFYWLFGGVWGLEHVIPTKKEALSSLSIPPLATLVVALLLVCCGVLYLINVGIILLQLPNWINSYVYWVIPSIFILRAIGDFNYVGFFKKIKYSKFAKADSKLFSPLCLGIGIAGIIIQLLK